MAAADAHRLRLAGGVVLLIREAQQGIGVLYHWGIQIPLHRPGHGAAGENDHRLLPQAAGRLQQAAQRGADGHPQVPRAGHRAAAYRHRPVGQGLPFIRAERTIYTVATLNTEHFTSSADWPGGTSRPVTVRISCFSMPRG